MPQNHHGHVRIVIYQMQRAVKKVRVSGGLGLLDALGHKRSQNASRGLMVLPSVPFGEIFSEKHGPPLKKEKFQSLSSH